jgi:hypothetical protein
LIQVSDYMLLGASGSFPHDNKMKDLNETWYTYAWWWEEEAYW